MANNNTKNPNAPVPSQTDDQTIVGQPPVQALPATTGKPALATNSVTGDKSVSTYNDKKGKGNN